MTEIVTVIEAIGLIETGALIETVASIEIGSRHRVEDGRAREGATAKGRS